MADAPKTEEPAEGKKKGGRGKLLILLVPVLLLAVGGGLFASGMLKGLLGGDPPPPEAEQAEADVPKPGPPVFMDMPEIIANLNVPGRRSSFLKLRSKLEVSRAEDVAAVEAAMPRMIDLFTTYLREMRPEELRGSAGTYRLREELMARANIALAASAQPGRRPGRVTDVLFLEILQQ